MEVDFESAWFRLKAHVATKRSHGADELKVVMADLEVQAAREVGPSAPPAQTDTRPATEALALTGRGVGDG